MSSPTGFRTVGKQGKRPAFFEPAFRSVSVSPRGESIQRLQAVREQKRGAKPKEKTKKMKKHVTFEEPTLASEAEIIEGGFEPEGGLALFREECEDIFPTSPEDQNLCRRGQKAFLGMTERQRMAFAPETSTRSPRTVFRSAANLARQWELERKARS